MKKKVTPKKAFSQTKFDSAKKKVFPTTTKAVPRQGDVLGGYRKAMQSGKLGGKGWGP